MPYKRKRLAYRRLTVSLLVLTAVIVALASAMCYTLFNRSFTRELISTNESTISYLTDLFHAATLEKGQMLISDLSANANYATPLAVFCQNGPLSNVALLQAHRALSDVANLYNNMFSSIVVYYPARGFFLSNNMGYKRMKDPYNLAYRNFIESLTAGPLPRISWLRTSKESSLPIISQSSLVLTSVARWYGVTSASPAILILIFNPSYVQESLEKMAFGESKVYLVDPSGTAVASSAGAVLERPLDEYPWGEALLSQGAGQSSDQHLYTLSPIRNTQWSILYATPIGSFAKASTQVAHFTLWIVVGSLAVGLALSVWFSRRLYSPLRQLMDTVDELPNEAKGGASRDEYGLLHTALDHLTSRLNDVERLLHVNRPMIRNMIVHDLLCGTQQAHTLTGESMRLAEIALSHPHFNVLVVEWSEANLVSLPPENRQTLQYALLEALVNCHETDRLRLFAYFPSRTRMVLLLNAKTPDSSLLESIAHSAREYLAPQQIACMSAVGEWTQAQGGIRAAYQTANRLIDLRLFQAPSTLIVKPTGVSQENNAAVELESRYLSHLHGNRILDALVCVQQLTSVWQNIPPSEALRSLRKISASTRDVLIRMRYNVNHALPLLVIQPQQAVWHISEYPAAMEALLAGAFQSADTARRDRNEVLLERTIAYLQEHLAEDLSLERIAEAMHFHAKYFSRLFKELSGMNLVDYIMAQRLERAAMMLRHEKGLSIEAIGAQVGYNSPQYFNRRFKEAYGMTPREYRLREGTQVPRQSRG